MFEISYIAIPLLIISAIPQTIRLLKRKSSKDISIVTYVMTWLGIFFILFDATGGVFWSNMASLVMLTMNLLLIIYYRYA